jgi:RNA-directed DNA polymerase
VRFADDIVVGFQYRSEAERFWEELRERFGRFNLELHPQKTRLIEFGRFAAQSRKRRGQGKPETFDFLGFTHICSRKRNGKFVVLRRPMRTRMRAKLRAVKAELRRRLHDPVPEVARWLGSVVRGYYQYYGVPRTTHVMVRFRYYVLRMWYRSLQRRSHKTLMTWARMCRIAQCWVPWPRIVHPYPEQRLCVSTLGRSPVR